MVDREKVIKAFEECICKSHKYCTECYQEGPGFRMICRNTVCFDVLAMLKKQGNICADAERKRGCEMGMINKPLNYMGYEVTTIEDPELGSFHYDKKHGLIDWESADRMDGLSVSVDKLKAFLHKAEEIFAILGVDVND